MMRERSSGSRRRATTERLLRFNAWKVAATPSRKGGPHMRASSPSGFSTFTTSAPRSERIWPAYGAATLWPNSTTTMPASGAPWFCKTVIASSVHLDACRLDELAATLKVGLLLRGELGRRVAYGH